MRKLKYCIDLQHFDEIRVRLRLLGTTIYFAALGVAFTPLTFQSDIQYIGNYGLSSIIFFITFLFSFTLLLMERYFKGLMHQAITYKILGVATNNVEYIEYAIELCIKSLRFFTKNKYI